MTQGRFPPQEQRDFAWRSILLPAYGPTALASIGAGALVPVVPLTATAMGGSVGAAAFIVALASIGQLCGDLPAGAIAARIGERRALIVAGIVDAAAMVLAYFSATLVVLGIAVFVSGLAGSVFNLARHTYMTVAIPLKFRARALSSLGGVTRIGMFLGPFAAAALVALWNVHAVYLFAALTGLGATVIAGIHGELPGEEHVDRGTKDGDAKGPSFLRIVREQRQVLVTLGVGVLLLCAARGARDAMLPLWAEAQHLDPVTISLIFGIAAGLELLVVYPGGALMDRYGRLVVGVPATIAIGIGLLVLPLATSAVTIALLACLMGLGNGLSSGLVLTLGSDAAPATGRAKFLGVWRLFADTGRVAAPGLISVVTLFAPLAAAGLALGAVSLIGAAVLARARRGRTTRVG